VAPAGKVDGVRAVLKVGMPHREARTEAAGLRFFAGQGAVRLLRADEEVFALVEERCEPGNELWDLPVDEGNQVATELLRQLWRRADGTAPIERLSDLAKEWGAGIPGLGRNYPPDLAELGIDLADELGTLGELARQVDYFADTLGIERDRVIGWTVVKALAWDWGPETTQAFASLL
jgi:streptomycin 6-kinase